MTGVAGAAGGEAAGGGGGTGAGGAFSAPGGDAGVAGAAGGAPVAGGWRGFSRSGSGGGLGSSLMGFRLNKFSVKRNQKDSLAVCRWIRHLFAKRANIA